MVFVRQERAALARDVRAGIGDYLGALMISVAELTRAPENAPDVDIGRWVAESAPDPVRRWFDAQRWIKTEKRTRTVLGPRPYANVERVVLAYAHMQILPLPDPLAGPLLKSLNYVEELAETRTREVKDRWPEVREALLAAVRAHLVDADELARAMRAPS